jgi:hypothetical protein
LIDSIRPLPFYVFPNGIVMDKAFSLGSETERYARASRIGRAVLMLSVLLAVPFAAALPASASSIDLGSLSNYAVVDLGSGTTNLSGNNGGITGTLYYDSTVAPSNNFAQLQSTQSVSTAVAQKALSQASSKGTLSLSQISGNNVSSTTAAGYGGTSGANGGSGTSGSSNTDQTMSGVSLSQLQYSMAGASGQTPQMSGANSNSWSAGTSTGGLTSTPLPAALPLFASGLAALGLFGRRKKRGSASA